MGEVVNLRRVRKARLKVEAETTAAANRLHHGRKRGEREAEAMESGRAERLLDGARLEAPPVLTTGRPGFED